MIDPEMLRALPKVELHCHLEGSLRPTTLVELADRHGIPLPSSDPAELYGHADLAGFLAVYEIACDALRTPDDFARASYESLEDAARCNVRYREMFFNPTLHPSLGYRSMLAGILDGLRAAEADHGIVARLIPSIYRQHSVASAQEMLDDVIAHRTDEVIGIGMDGDELLDPPDAFAAVYRRAATAGLHRAAHVAHDGPAAWISTVLEQLGCERVDHGYHVVDDPPLLARLAESGVAFLCATPTPPLCGWPDDFDASPIRRMIDSGLRVVLNSDDPAMLHTDLGEEYVKVCAGWGLPPARVRQFVTDAIDASWLDDTDRRALVGRLLPEVDAVLGTAPAGLRRT